MTNSDPSEHGVVRSRPAPTSATSPTSNTSSKTTRVAGPSLWDWIVFYIASVAHMGLPILSALLGYKAKWTSADMEDQTGKVIVVTGGNSGTGYETAKAYYEHGAKVYVLCRSEERALEAIKEIKKGGSRNIMGQMVYKQPTTTVGSLQYLNLDLADLDSVEAAAKELLSKEQRLDVLFANAGIMAVDPGQYTKQGYSLQFGTNVVGHQHLISRLLPLLKQTSVACPTSPSRLILTSSLGHQFAPSRGRSDGGIDYSAVKRGGTQLDKWAEYGASKWGNIALAKYVNEHYGPASHFSDGQILAFSVHPGLVATNLANHLGFTAFMRSSSVVMKATQMTPAQGALNQLWAANMSFAEATRLSGSYISCVESVVPARPDLRYPEVWNKLWNWCEAETKYAA